MMEPISILYEKISSVCPIVSVRIGSQDDKSSWSIEFSDDVTAQQIDSANSILSSFDFNNPETSDQIDKRLKREIVDHLIDNGQKFMLDIIFDLQNRLLKLEQKQTLSKDEYVHVFIQKYVESKKDVIVVPPDALVLSEAIK